MNRKKFNGKKQSDKKKRQIRAMLKVVLKDDPTSHFFLGLERSYQKYGTLSQKQLFKLKDRYDRLKRKKTVGKSWWGDTKIKETIDRGPDPILSPLYKKDEEIQILINEILVRKEDHKAALLLKAKVDQNIPLSVPEKSQLKKMHKMITDGKTG